jgi:hypothetical protein
MGSYEKFSDKLKSEICAPTPAKAAKPAKIMDKPCVFNGVVGSAGRGFEVGATTGLDCGMEVAAKQNAEADATKPSHFNSKGPTLATLATLAEVPLQFPEQDRVAADLAALSPAAHTAVIAEPDGSAEAYIRPPGGQWSSPLPVRPPRFVMPQRADRFPMSTCTGWCSRCGAPSTWRADPPTAPNAQGWRCVKCERGRASPPVSAA